MFQKVKTCPICSSNKFSNFIIAQDYLVSNDSFAIIKCDQCGFKITSPRPIDEELGNYYKSQNYISHTSKANNPINLIYKLVRNYTLTQKYKMINKRVKKDRILDYGCGTGDFLNYFKNKGWNIDGIEPDEDAALIAAEKNATEITKNISDKKQKYSAITLWHVLEHISDLNNVLEKLKAQLDNKGRMFIAVPNLKSYDAQYYQEHWAGYDLPRHLYHFDKSTMKKLMKKHGLKIKEIIPMYFDSYYVCMLSEKYKTGKNNYLTALKMGYKSNKEAKKDLNYSSLIYVIKK